ncbi:MAG: hypothetical protein BGO45_10705 [Microbacterium sp. 71-36]|uniref:hypothetical protein n=1 Tax=unclassified Microbacterium TaxID=2609290 RepID=UPI00086DA17B|nr:MULTISPECIES: hypothetical protein [unclassified Microbacterium]MBN9210736.1 hypothetical protein [Microbacterium sp.]ODT36016.1 MAG: hypothetical protein ABS60_16880 [Microbacterium sp. SCN 71-17]OJV77258.1 MAG: hypothetical protein BGO45_10705 [Microbacterium sp. 71-36]
MPTQQRIFIAENYLRILRTDPNPTIVTETYYVSIAARHGVSLERIAELTGIPLNRVDRLVNG